MNFRNIKLELDKSSLIDFIKKNVRQVYSKNIFEWQYGSSSSNLFIAETKEQIEGTQGMIFTELIYQGKRIHSSKSETTYLTKNCRGIGAFEKIYNLSVNDAFDKGSEFIWGFTALGSVWDKKLHFNYCDLVYESVIFLNPRKTDSFSRKIYKKLIHFCLKSKLYFSSKYVYEISTQLSEFKLNNNFHEEKDIYLDFDSYSYLNRTVNNPFIKYYLMKIKNEKNEIKATIIFQESFDCFIISDIQYFEDADLNKIIRTIISYCFEKNKNFEIKFWANKSNKKYKEIFNCMKNFKAKEYAINDMQFIYKTKRNPFKFEDLFINSLWTEGYKY